MGHEKDRPEPVGSDRTIAEKPQEVREDPSERRWKCEKIRRKPGVK